MNFKKGFTLIELLMVAALIALLAAVVLVALKSAKDKGDDAGVKSNLRTVTSQSELFYLENGNSYLPPGGVPFGIAPCPGYDLSGSNMLSGNKVVAAAIKEAEKRGAGSSCYNGHDAWAVAIGLSLSPGTSWCIDNQGAGRQVNYPPLLAINNSTFKCNQ